MDALARKNDRRPDRHVAPGRPARPATQPSGLRQEPTRPARHRGRDERRSDPDVVVLWGFHSVREALRSPRRTILRLLLTEAATERLAGEIAARSLEPTVVTNDELSGRLPRDAVHQGMVLEARPLPSATLEDLPAQGLVLVLDQVTDPHNVGAILRTAAAFGVTALVTTERHAPEMTGVLGKAASGALEHVPIVTVVNLARALEKLGDLGYLRIGLDSDGSVPLPGVSVDPATALVLGAEGKGLRRLTRENCDVVARLDLPGAIRSLNVSNACAAALTVLQLRGGSPQT